jgi:hypothetical protein
LLVAQRGDRAVVHGPSVEPEINLTPQLNIMSRVCLRHARKSHNGRLPHGGQERVETIAALAVRMGETVRQLSHEWEARADPVRSL